jgi:uncharacterized Ntn-hydrolase superfamily protein
VEWIDRKCQKRVQVWARKKNASEFADFVNACVDQFKKIIRTKVYSKFGFWIMTNKFNCKYTSEIIKK